MKKILILAFTFAVLVPGLALALTQGGNPTGSGGNPTGSGGGSTGSGGNPTGSGSTDFSVKLKNPFKVGDTLYEVVKAVVNDVVLPIGGVLCVLAFIYAGFKYVTAGGNSKTITDANNALLFAAIGTAVLLGSWTLMQVVDKTIKSITG